MSEEPSEKADSEPYNDKNDPKQAAPIANAPKILDQQNRTNPSEQSQDPPKRTFLRRHDGFDVINLLVLIFTFGAVSLAAYEAGRLADLTDQLVRDGQDTGRVQAELTRASNQLNRDALIASSRAWVGPIDAKIVGTVELEKPVKVIISIRNTGREPAKNFRWIPEHFITTGDMDVAVGQKIDSSLRFCFGTPSTVSGQVIFPSTGFGSGADFPIEFSKDEIDEGVIAGEKTLVIQGCIAYESFGAARHSAFCYLFKNKIGATDHLNICDGGSNAD
jgi:hypothetical protein